MFDVLFLGTCACDYSEKLKNELRDSFDLDARRSSCLLLNGRFLIDCGEHTLDSLRIAKIDEKTITDILITHLHDDHFNAEHIEKIASAKAEKLRLWVREDAEIPDLKNVELVRMKKGVRYALDGKLQVTGLLANHDETAFPQHFLLESGEEKFLYACDGAWFLNETYYRLKDARLSLLVLDGTCGDYVGDYRMGEHNSVPMIRLMLPSLKNWGTVTEDTQIYLSHIAPSLHKPHEETERFLEKDGLKLAYDGLRIRI